MICTINCTSKWCTIPWPTLSHFISSQHVGVRTKRHDLSDCFPLFILLFCTIIILSTFLLVFVIVLFLIHCVHTTSIIYSYTKHSSLAFIMYLRLYKQFATWCVLCLNPNSLYCRLFGVQFIYIYLWNCIQLYALSTHFIPSFIFYHSSLAHITQTWISYIRIIFPQLPFSIYN